MHNISPKIRYFATVNIFYLMFRMISEPQVLFIFESFTDSS